MNGIICIDSIEVVGHSLFNNFRLALKNYLKADFRDINGSSDLSNITHLFIIDEHFIPHTGIWKNDDFIHEVNRLKITVIVFNFEKIHNSSFPWNIDHQRKLENFNNLHQFVSDLNDSHILSKSILNKQLLSQSTRLNADFQAKNDRIIFIGQLNSFYPTRHAILNEFKASELPLDIIITDRKMTYNEFLMTLGKYTFVLNPLGTGNFINLRFYEALKLGCIPIQQITPEMVDKYSELTNSINFIKPSEINAQKLKSYTQQPFNYYLEDYFEDIKLKNSL